MNQALNENLYAVIIFNSTDRWVRLIIVRHFLSKGIQEE